MLVIVLLLIAAVIFGVCAFWQRSLLAGGLLAWVLSVLLPKLL